MTAASSTPVLRCTCASRRRLLRHLGATTLLGGVALLGLAACDQKDSTHAAGPKDFDNSTACELDGMILADYPGPKGQVQVDGGQAETLFFCDTVELLATLLRPEQVRKVKAAYVQDMGQAEWDNPRGHWIDVKSAWFVVGGKRKGSMGPTIATFAQEPDAQKFTREYGGKAVRFGDITPDMVDLSGGAQHDSRM